jgi:FtsP/CotA-like multicopper oxidase with cupredoxin domain
MMYLHECHKIPSTAGADLIVHWDVNTHTLINPASASISVSQIGYQFDHRMQNHGMDPAMDDSFEQTLMTAAPKAGTYERWYFINLEASNAAQGAPPPDMHPVHIHLVNFYLARAWRVADPCCHPVTPLSITKQVVPVTNLGLYAKLGLRDTVRVPGNYILEFIVYFPPGYTQPTSKTNRYPFHCHILEHEEMGMMRYFYYN